mgnify:FL=1
MYKRQTKTGARFFDTDNNGVADYVHIGLVDGGYGDKDGEVNGEIDDPSTFGSVTMDANWVQIEETPSSTTKDPLTGDDIVTPATYFDNILRLYDSNNISAKANHLINIELASDTLTSTVDKIGYIVSDIGESITYELISNDGSTLFSTLEKTDVTLTVKNDQDVEEGISSIAKQDILLGNDQQISFYRLNCLLYTSPSPRDY